MFSLLERGALRAGEAFGTRAARAVPEALELAPRSAARLAEDSAAHIAEREVAVAAEREAARAAEREAAQVAEEAARVEGSAAAAKEASAGGASTINNIRQSSRGSGMARNADRLGLAAGTLITAGTGAYVAIRQMNNLENLVKGIPNWIKEGVDAAKDPFDRAVHGTEDAFHNAAEETKHLLEAGKQAAANMPGAQTLQAVRVVEAIVSVAVVGATVYVIYRGVRYFR